MHKAVSRDWDPVQGDNKGLVVTHNLPYHTKFISDLTVSQTLCNSIFLNSEVILYKSSETQFPYFKIPVLENIIMSLLSTTTTTTTKHPPPLILKFGHYQIGSFQSSFEVQKMFYLTAFKYVLSFKVNPTDLQMKRIKQQGNYDWFFYPLHFLNLIFSINSNDLSNFI